MTAVPTPVFSILTVARNSLDVTRAAVLRTLRHIRGQDARLIVADRASTDGTGAWLDLMVRRGEIGLVRCPTDLGNGPALERARSGVRSPFLVVLDGDTSPVSDDWLSRLRGLLVG